MTAPVTIGRAAPDIEGLQRRLRDFRKARGMSLEAVAKAAGMTKSHIWEMERGKSVNPTVRSIWAISGALCVPPLWLLGLETDTPPCDPLALEVAALINARLQERTECAVRNQHTHFGQLPRQDNGEGSWT